MSEVNEFGGEWTKEKLEILEKYLNAYTTALKKQSFQLVYVDAFAGSGIINLPPQTGMPEGELLGEQHGQPRESSIKGSAKIAVEIKNRAFDKLLLNDLDIDKVRSLKTQFSADGRVKVSQKDANVFLNSLPNRDWKKCRGVLFIDPFATELDWKTLETVAGLKVLDIWLLFPIMAVARTMPKEKSPEKISPDWAKKLTRIFGDESWRNLYKLREQEGLFGSVSDDVRLEGSEGILRCYKQRLRGLFGNRLLEESKTFYGPNNAPLFELIFCVGSNAPTAINLAKRIAEGTIKPGD